MVAVVGARIFMNPGQMPRQLEEAAVVEQVVPLPPLLALAYLDRAQTVVQIQRAGTLALEAAVQVRRVVTQLATPAWRWLETAAAELPLALQDHQSPERAAVAAVVALALATTVALAALAGGGKEEALPPQMQMERRTLAAAAVLRFGLPVLLQGQAAPASSSCATPIPSPSPTQVAD
jgi:hypothetical protein